MLGLHSASRSHLGLGALWCKLLTGEPPFRGADAESVRRSAVRGKTEEALARLRRWGADPEVVALCQRCLAIEPEDRPGDANEVAAKVAELRVAAAERARQAELAKARAEVAAAEQTKRRLVALRSVAVVLLFGLIGTGIGFWNADAAKRRAQAAGKDAGEKRLAAESARTEAEQAKDREAAQKREAVAQAQLANAVLAAKHYERMLELHRPPWP